MLLLELTTSAEAIARWEKTYGESFPTETWDWQRWLARIDAPGRFLSADMITEGDWTDAELLPFIEGYLLRLKDLATTSIEEKSEMSFDNSRDAATILSEAMKPVPDRMVAPPGCAQSAQTR